MSRTVLETRIAGCPDCSNTVQRTEDSDPFYNCPNCEWSGTDPE